MIDDTPVSNLDIEFLRKNIAAVLNNFDFKTNYVKEELLYYQNVLNITPEVAYKNIERFSKFFDIEELLESKIEYLTIYEKAFIKILSLLIINPSILGIDDMLTYLTTSQKLKIIKYAKNNKICILNVTTNPEELLYGTDIIIFAFGADLTSVEDYSGEKFEYLKSQGYNYYCNVDSSQYFVQIRSNYFRQGRRNLDGYRMYYNPELLSDLFDAQEVFDSSRPVPVPTMG